MRQLQNVIASDLPEIERLIRDDQPLFPEYTGRRPQGPTAQALRCDVSPGRAPNSRRLRISDGRPWAPTSAGVPPPTPMPSR